MSFVKAIQVGTPLPAAAWQYCEFFYIILLQGLIEGAKICEQLMASVTATENYRKGP